MSAGEWIFLVLFVAFLAARLIFVVIPECRQMRRLDEERHRRWAEEFEGWRRRSEGPDPLGLLDWSDDLSLRLSRRQLSMRGGDGGGTS